MSSVSIGSLNLFTPRIDTECERCLERLNKLPQGSKDEKVALLSQLLMKQYLSPDELFHTTADTIKTLAIQAVNLNLNPPADIEERNYVWNIKNLYTELRLRCTPMAPAERTLIKKHLQGNYRKLKPLEPKSLSEKSAPVLYEKPIGTPVFPESSPPDILVNDRIQWLFQVLNPRMELSKIENWPNHIHPHVLVLGYKRFISTEQFLDSIRKALSDTSFFIPHKLFFRMTDLLSTWLNTRYYTHELSKPHITEKFDQIFTLLNAIKEKTTITKTIPAMNSEITILQVAFTNACNATPRKKTESMCLSPIEQLITDLATWKKAEAMERASKALADEITSFFVGYLVGIPIEEFFGDHTTMNDTPQLFELANGFNALLLWLNEQFKVYDHPPNSAPTLEEHEKRLLASTSSSSFLRLRSSSHAVEVSPGKQVHVAEEHSENNLLTPRRSRLKEVLTKRKSVELHEEPVLTPERIALRKNKLQQSLIRAMTIAVNNREYHTAFILKLVYNGLANKQRDLKLSEETQTSYQAIETLFDLAKNLNNLRSCYQAWGIAGEKYFPVLVYVTRDLIMAREISKKVTHTGFKAFNIKPFNVNFKIIHPIVHFLKNAPLHTPKTTLKFKVLSGSLKAASSSSTDPAPTASQSQNPPHEDPQVC